MTAVMILQKFLFDFDEVFEKLISFEPIKSSAEDGSLRITPVFVLVLSRPS